MALYFVRFSPSKVQTPIDKNIIEMLERNGVWVSKQSLAPKILSETKRKKPGIKLSSRGWADSGHVRKGWQYNYDGGTLNETPASPAPASFETAMNNCDGEYHM